MYKTFFSSVGIYAFGNVLNALVPFLLLPILSRFLTPSEYGVFSLYMVLVNGVVPFAGLQISRSIMRSYVDRELIDISSYIYNCILISTISTSFLTAFFFLLADPLSQLSSFPRAWLFAPLIASYGQTYLAVCLSVLQMEEKPILYSAIRVGHSIVLASITLYLVIALNWGWEGTVLGHTVSMVVLIPIVLILLRRMQRIRASLSLVYVRDALRYGAPLLPHVIGTVVVTMIDRLFIANYLGQDAVGIYSAGYQMSLVVFILVTSFNQAWTPWLFAQLKDGTANSKRDVVALMYGFFALIILCAILFFGFSSVFVEMYLASAYHEALIILPWLLCSMVFHGMYIVVGGFLYYTKNTFYLSICTLVAAVTSCFFNFILVPINGVIGAAQASVIAFATAFILTWCVSARFTSMPWLLTR